MTHKSAFHWLHLSALVFAYHSSLSDSLSPRQSTRKLALAIVGKKQRRDRRQTNSLTRDPAAVTVVSRLRSRSRLARDLRHSARHRERRRRRRARRAMDHPGNRTAEFSSARLDHEAAVSRSLIKPLAELTKRIECDIKRTALLLLASCDHGQDPTCYRSLPPPF